MDDLARLWFWRLADLTSVEHHIHLVYLNLGGEKIHFLIEVGAELT